MHLAQEYNSVYKLAPNLEPLESDAATWPLGHSAPLSYRKIEYSVWLRTFERTSGNKDAVPLSNIITL